MPEPGNLQRASFKDALIAFAGGGATIFLLALLTQDTHEVWIMAPFGGSCVLAFAVWDSPLAQPRNIFGGHCLSACVGLAVFHLCGTAPWAVGLAAGLAIALMMLTRTVHPPAGATPLVVMMEKAPLSFLWEPVCIGSLLVICAAITVNRLKKRPYPTYWL